MSKQRKAKKREQTTVINLDVHSIPQAEHHFGDSGFVLVFEQFKPRHLVVRLHLDTSQVGQIGSKIGDQLKHEHKKLRGEFDDLTEAGKAPQP